MKEQLQKACLPKISIQGQILFEILFQLCPDDCTQILVNLTPFTTLSTESNLEGFVWSHQSKTGLASPRQFSLLLAAKDFLPNETSLAERSDEKRLYSQATICPTLLLLDKWAFQMLFFQNIPTNSKFHKFNFYDVITQELYNRSSKLAKGAIANVSNRIHQKISILFHQLWDQDFISWDSNPSITNLIYKLSLDSTIELRELKTAAVCGTYMRDTTKQNLDPVAGKIIS